jgi:acyl carrier protein
VSIEEYYEKEFNPDDLTEENFSNVEKLCQLIEEKLL